MFRNVIPLLAEDLHVIAPDYPGYGLSSMPGVEEFEYSFAHVASIVDELLERRGFDHYALYLMDYGAPVGYRMAESHPERMTALIVQNDNVYIGGLLEFCDHRTNVPVYPGWQRYFRTHLPPPLNVCGKNDPICPAEGAHPYLRDPPDAELLRLNTGRFALEEDGLRIVGLIREFMSAKVATGAVEQ